MPAVAVIRGRLVLFIFNRFKGYLDGIFSPSKSGYGLTRVLCEGGSTYSVEMKFVDTMGKLVAAKATFYVQTDVEGRRLG